MGLLPSSAGGCQLNWSEVVVLFEIEGLRGIEGAVDTVQSLPASLIVQLKLVMILWR